MCTSSPLFFLVSIYFTIVLIRAEVITLINSNSMTCILTDRSVNSALYVHPLDKQVVRNMNELSDFVNNDWVVGRPNTFWFEPITDFRWENFQYIDDGIINLTNFTSFSICSNGHTIVSTDEFEHIPFGPRLNEGQECQWIHYTIEENKIHYFNGSDFKVHWSTALIPKQLQFDNKTKVKKHDYYFSYSITTSEVESYVNIKNGAHCVSLFVALDLNSVLEISFGSNYTKVQSSTLNRKIKKWQLVRLTSTTISDKLILKRSTLNDDVYGFWAIDHIHICKPKIDIFSANLQNHTCRSLVKSEIGFCHQSGFLGAQCNLQCSNVLGDDNPTCKNHTICLEDGTCDCAYGYQGDNCNLNRTTYQKSLKWIYVKKNTFRAKWADFNLRNVQFYNLEVTCKKKFCNDTSISRNITTRNISAEIHMEPLPCNIKLFFLFPNQEKEFIEAVEYQQPDHIPLSDNELPKSVLLKLKEVQLDFESCEFFNQPIQYVVEINCVSNWCINTPIKFEIFMNSYNIILQEKLEHISPFTKYRVNVQAKKGYEAMEKTYNVTSNPREPLRLQDLKVVSKTEHSVFVKWKDGYPPQGLTESYEIFVDHMNGYSSLSTTSTSYNITDLFPNTLYKITICAKNFNVSKLSAPIIVGVLTESGAKSIIKLQNHPVIDNKKRETSKALFYIIPTFLITILTTITIIAVIFIRKKHRLRENHQPEEQINLVYFSNNQNTDQIEESLQDLTPFRNIPTCTSSCKIGTDPINKSRNRNPDFVPYDDNRVILEMEENSYINASYINIGSKKYIISQSPKNTTIHDFWKMIWQENITVIVMATTFFDKDGNRACYEYWPSTSHTNNEYQEIAVSLEKEENFETFNIQNLKVYFKGVERHIQNIQVLWDTNFNLFANSILPVVKIVENISRGNSRILLHSRFGVNRAGTLVLCDLVLEMMNHSEVIDFEELLKKLRSQRPYVVENGNYYVLAHLIIMEYLAESPIQQSLENILEVNLCMTHTNHLKKQFAWDKILQNSLNVSAKLPMITCLGSYFNQKQFFICKSKIDQVQFLKTALHNDIKCVISFTSTKHKLWPFTKYQGIRLTKSDHVETFDSLKKSELLLTDNTQLQVCSENTIKLFELNWLLKELPASCEGIMRLIYEIHRLNKNEKIIIVSDKERITGVGIFLSILYATEKYEKEQKIDIFTPTRLFKRHFPKFQVNYGEVMFIYKSIHEYLKIFDEYEHVYEMGGTQ